MGGRDTWSGATSRWTAPGALDRALGGRGGSCSSPANRGSARRPSSALADGAADRSVVVAWGQCWNDSMAPPFWPWTQVLRELGHATNPAVRGSAPADADQAMATGRRSVRAVRRGRHCSSEAEAHGLVVVLDDLHWADEATLALLSFLSRHVPRSRC